MERADIPEKGKIRFTFDPRIEVWESVFGTQGRQPLGGFLTADSLGPATVPGLGSLNPAIQAASGLSAFAATLGNSLLAIRSERRTTPIAIEVGVTNRLSLGVMVPIVRVDVRETLRLDSTGNVGLNPKYFGYAPADSAFLHNFDAALAQLDAQIQGGSCAPNCAAATSLSQRAHGVRIAIGTATASPFLPVAGSPAGLGIDTAVIQIQRALQDTFAVSAFLDTLPLPVSRATPDDIQFLLSDPSFGYDYAPLIGTTKNEQYWMGDAELSAKYRLVEQGTYVGALKFVVRLPTGHQASPNDPFALSAGDHQTDLELGYIQEWTLAKRLWLNLNVRGGLQLAGQRERRVASPDLFWVLAAADARLDWKPGNYVAIDFAPMYRFAKTFSAGFTVGYYRQGLDHYTYPTSADSTALATRLGGPISASVLDPGTDRRFWQIGFAATYQGPIWETGFSVQQTVSGWGSGASVPAGTTFQIVFRTFHSLF